MSFISEMLEQLARAGINSKEAESVVKGIGRIVPEELPKIASPGAQTRHAAYLDSLVKSSPEKYTSINPSSTRAILGGSANLPSDIIEQTGTKTRFLASPDEVYNPAVFGQYHRGTKEAISNQYYPSADNESYSRLVGNPFHEAVAHPSHNYADALVGTKYDIGNTISNLKQIEGEKRYLHTLNDFDQDKLRLLLPKDTPLRAILPSENYATKLTSNFVDSIKGKTASEFRKNLPQQIDKITQEVLSSSDPVVRREGMRIAKNLAVTGVAVGGGLLTASTGNANEATSNVDIAGQGGSHETSQDTPRFNIPTGDPGKVVEDLGKVGKALMIPVNHAVEFFKETGQGMSEIGGALKSNEAARDYMATHAVTNPIGVMANVAGGSALSPGASLGKGAIQMQGFFSPLTKALESGVIGKSQLSAKMSGEQMLKTLQSAGIKEDELIFSGVGQKLSEIGKDRIGPTLFDELKNTAKEGALAFKRSDSPGIHSNYSLFSEGDPSFKNAVYSYPGVKFEEGHFGEGVVAHRRFGDKEVTPIYSFNDAENKRIEELDQVFKSAPSVPERMAAHKEALSIFNNRVQRNRNDLHLDEVQSQFYEQGSKFGHGEPKVPLATTEEGKLFYRATEHLMKGDNTSVKLFNSFKEAYPKIAEDAEKYYQHYLDASRADRSTSQGFAKGIQADANQEATFKRYLKPEDLSVDSAPLRGEKYVELLAKDHLRDALASGKDAISWTPSEVQHERYYGKNALGSIKWEFSGGQKLSEKDFMDIFHQDVDQNIGTLREVRYRVGNGEFGSQNEIVQRMLDKYDNSTLKVDPIITITTPNGKSVELKDIDSITKNMGSAATKKLLEDMQNGITSGTLEGNAKEVYQKLYDRAIPKAFEKLTGEKPREGWVKGRNGEDVQINWVPLDKTKENMKRFIEELDRLPAKAKRSTVAVKPLPIAKADNVANDFFSGGGVQQQAMPQGAYGMKDILNEVAWG